jgi:hypothetical protein
MERRSGVVVVIIDLAAVRECSKCTYSLVGGSL